MFIFFEMKKKEVSNLSNKKTTRTLMFEMIARSGKRWMCFFDNVWPLYLRQSWFNRKWVPLQDDFPRMFVAGEEFDLPNCFAPARVRSNLWCFWSYAYSLFFFLSFNVSNLRNHSLKAWFPGCSANVWLLSFFISKSNFSVPKSSPETSHPMGPADDLGLWIRLFPRPQIQEHLMDWWHPPIGSL